MSSISIAIDCRLARLAIVTQLLESPLLLFVEQRQIDMHGRDRRAFGQHGQMNLGASLSLVTLNHVIAVDHGQHIDGSVNETLAFQSWHDARRPKEWRR